MFLGQNLKVPQDSLAYNNWRHAASRKKYDSLLFYFKYVQYLPKAVHTLRWMGELVQDQIS